MQQKSPKSIDVLNHIFDVLNHNCSKLYNNSKEVCQQEEKKVGFINKMN